MRGCGAEVKEEVVKRGISPWRGCRVVGAIARGHQQE